MPRAFCLFKAVLELVFTAPVQGEAVDFGRTPGLGALTRPWLFAPPSPCLTADFVYDISLCRCLFCTKSVF